MVEEHVMRRREPCLELAGLDPLPGASGRSFRPLLTAADAVWNDTALAEHAERGSDVVCRMVRSGGWKFNYYHGMQPELFHLQHDPGETINLSGRLQYGAGTDGR